MKKALTVVALLIGGFGSLVAQELVPLSVSFNYDFQTAIISSLEVEVGNPDNFSVNSDYRIQVFIDGIGTISCLGSDYMVDWFNVGGIPANSTKIYNLPNIDLDQVDNSCGLPTGNYHLRVVLDVDDDVWEDDETNNEASYTASDFYFESLATSVDPAERLDAVQIYPNPAQQKIYIDRGAFSGEILIDLYSIEGKLLKSQTSDYHESKTLIDLSEYQPGFYLLRFTHNGNQQVRKFLIQ